MKPKHCPKCNSKSIANILWGYPVRSAKLDRALEERRTVLGGCCVGLDDPNWQCNYCSHMWK